MIKLTPFPTLPVTLPKDKLYFQGNFIKNGLYGLYKSESNEYSRVTTLGGAIYNDGFIDNISGNFEISDIENNKIFNGTYYTLKHFNHPYFAMGSDCLFDLHKWINYHDLVKENKFIVFTRSSDINKIINFIKEDE